MKKIAVIGPESTGKSELSRLLAEHFAAPWEPELAREYIEKLDRPYTFEDVEEIARRQIALEKKYALHSEAPYVFFDTELIITKVWFEHKYGVVPRFLTEHLATTRFFDFYLLCKPDLPWVYDPLRENGDNRDYFFNWYKCEVEQLHFPYAVIGGSGNDRCRNALEAIARLSQNG